MHDEIVNYLTAKASDQSESLSARFARPAVTLLMSSRAYRTRDRAGLKGLAQDLKVENLVAIRLAQKYPDVFHPNVIRSRQTGNQVYDAVIKMVDSGQKLPDQAA